ncbi:MAG: amidohydrolase family protein [Acidobacteria bacterium]|nr:amidohydrolase family protein [Acidobacteriota bacterium]
MTLQQAETPPMPISRRDAIRLGMGGAMASLLPNLAVNGRAVAADSPKDAAAKSIATEEDRNFFEREIESFLPDKIFDAHAHLFKQGTVSWDLKGLPPQVGYPEYQALIQDLHPKRRTAALFLPAFSPDKKDLLPQCNEWISQQVALSKDCVGGFFVKPEDDPEWVRQEVKRLKLRGFKCYHTMAAVTPTWETQIPDYLPEQLVKVAGEEGWSITLHMVRSRAAADEGNQRWIERYCRQYPNLTLILAHSARGFQPAHNLEGLHNLKGLDNLYFDTSANCEPIAHQAIMRIIGHKKMLYGSDFHVSHLRGRSVAVADSFLWLYEETPVWKEKQGTIKPVMVGLENLRSLKWACWSERLSDNAVEDIFWNNAAKLFGIS